MKLLLGAASAAVLLAGPAFAQTPMTTSFYGNVGYTNFSLDQIEDEEVGDVDFNLGAVTGRVGARFGQYLGVEGEASVGITEEEEGDSFGRVSTKLNYEIAGFGVAFLPVSPNADLFARLGVGTAELEVEFSDNFGSDSVQGSDEFVALGVGGQYSFDGVNGIRADYTRYNGDIEFDALSVSYVRRF